MMYFTIRSLPKKTTRITTYAIQQGNRILYRISFKGTVSPPGTGSFVRYTVYTFARSFPPGVYMYRATLTLDSQSQTRAWRFAVVKNIPIGRFAQDALADFRTAPASGPGGARSQPAMRGGAYSPDRDGSPLRPGSWHVHIPGLSEPVPRMVAALARPEFTEVRTSWGSGLVAQSTIEGILLITTDPVVAQYPGPVRKVGGTVTSPIYELFAQAIADRKQIFCTYERLPRELCPHILGRTKDEEVALTYQFGGESKSGLPPGGEWRCLTLSKVRKVQLRNGPWHAGSRHTRPQHCVEVVDIDVNPSSPYRPKRKL